MPVQSGTFWKNDGNDAGEREHNLGTVLLELAVNWEAEKLYDVEGFGPFDEF